MLKGFLTESYYITLIGSLPEEGEEKKHRRTAIKQSEYQTSGMHFFLFVFLFGNCENSIPGKQFIQGYGKKLRYCLQGINIGISSAGIT